eukprot:1016525-Alexandrium_andersonii.AAC.1
MSLSPMPGPGDQIRESSGAPRWLRLLAGVGNSTRHHCRRIPCEEASRAIVLQDVAACCMCC